MRIDPFTFHCAVVDDSGTQAFGQSTQFFRSLDVTMLHGAKPCHGLQSEIDPQWQRLLRSHESSQWFQELGVDFSAADWESGLVPEGRGFDSQSRRRLCIPRVT